MRHCVDICLEIVFFKWGNLVWMNGFGKKVSGRMGHVTTRSCLLPPLQVENIHIFSLYIAETNVTVPP